MTYDVFLDCRGMVCPMPLVKTRQALMVVEPGATVCVLATDPASMADFTSFCEATGHKLLKADHEAPVYVYVVEKAAAGASRDDEGWGGDAVKVPI